MRIDLFAYNVYFGDCFLLVLTYPDGAKRSVLIDFGSTGKGKTDHGPVVDDSDETNAETTGARLLKVANHISQTCGNSLDVIVATHRHKDHVYGFGLKEAGKIILNCKPKIVIQSWTEDPNDNRDMSKKVSVNNGTQFEADPRKNFALMLDDMHQVAGAIEAEALRLGDRNVFTQAISSDLKERIVFAADDNKIKNKAAVENLRAMSENPQSEGHFVFYGYDKIDWNSILPGVKVSILGPPSLDQSSQITSATNTSSEFWSLMAMNQYFWGVQAATNPVVRDAGGLAPLFPREKAMLKNRPANVRWIIRRLRSLRASQLLELVKFVDGALNNTSVILLFEIGDQKLLFPGDAQIENWRYALEQPGIKALLADTTLYKVGHHGSRNATPKSLWNKFSKKSIDTNKSNRLKTVISTMKGKHGETPETAVPLPKMVTEMKNQSEYRSTEELRGAIFDQITIVVE